MRLRRILPTRGFFPGVFLLCATAAPAQGPVMTPFQFLPGDGAIGPAAGDQRSAQVAPGGNLLLAVWEDHRTDLVGNLLSDEGGADVFAARFDASGALLDAVPIALSLEAGDQTKPRVAWNGAEWLVVWTSQVPTQFYWTTAVHAARVSPQGFLLDASPIAVVTFPNGGQNAELFGVASDGSNWLVAWKDYVGSSWAIQGKRVGASGAVLDPAPVALQAGIQSQPYGGTLAFATDEYLLVWKEWRFPTDDDLFGKRLTPVLAPLGGTFPIAALTHYDVSPALATDGIDFFVAWENYNTCCVGGGGKVYGTRISHAGAVLDAGGILVADYGSITVGRDPSVAWDGTDWVVAWVDDRASFGDLEIYAARVSPAAAVLDPNGFPVALHPARQEDPFVAGRPGGGSMILWQDVRAGGASPSDLYAATIDSAGIPSAAYCATLGAPSQVQPQLAAQPAGALALYVSAISGSSRLLAHRLDAYGVPIGPAPTEVAPFSTNLRNPALAFDGARYLAVWEDAGSILGRRLGLDGAPIDPAPFVVMPGSTPDVAALGGDFAVVATHAPSNPQYRFPYARRVRGLDGALLGAGPLALGQSFAQRPEIAAMGPHWIAVWQRNFSHDDPHANIHAAFLETNGTTPGEFQVTGGLGQSVNSAFVASDGSAALIGWASNASDILSADLHARLLLPGGGMLPVFTLSGAPYPQTAPALAWDGVRYVAQFQDRRNVTFFVDGRNDLYGARVDSAGALLDPSGFAVAAGPLSEIHPAVAGVAGSATLAGAHFKPLPPFGAYRVAVRVLDPPGCGGAVAAYGPGCAGSGGFVPSYAVLGCPEAGHPIALEVSGALGGSTALLAFGLFQAAFPLPGGCSLLVDPLLPFVPAVSLSGSGPGTGSGTLLLPLPPGLVGGVATTQAFVLDPGAAAGFAASNGVQVTIP